MSTKRKPLTIDEKAANLIEQARTVYARVFEDGPTDDDPDDAVTLAQRRDAALFGYLAGIAFTTDNDEIREVAYHAMQMQFGWDDEFIATEIIGG